MHATEYPRLMVQELRPEGYVLRVRRSTNTRLPRKADSRQAEWAGFGEWVYTEPLTITEATNALCLEVDGVPCGCVP